MPGWLGSTVPVSYTHLDVYKRQQLQYAVSEDVSADAREELLGDVLQFGEQLNSQMTYMYLCNIMDEFHAAQDESAMVMNNDITDKEAIQGIQASDLVSMVPDVYKRQSL